jgi:FAD/FMN-containing dehydrogenase
MTRSAAGWAGLRESVRGRVLLPGDDEYETARLVWNADVDRRPDVVVRPVDEADVAAAVRVAAERETPICVRSGGHHHAGHAVADGALMLDLSELRTVRVDTDAHTVTTQPGATWGELDGACAAHGLATTGADIPVVGVAGAVLGGGFGWLHRRFGLSCDNLVAARLVTADGVVTIVDEHDPDLLWGLRGGGGTLGVVTELTLQLHPVGPVATTVALLPIDKAREALELYRDLTTGAPDELFVRAVLMTAPPAPFVPEELRGRPALLLAGAWIGDLAGAEAGLLPLSRLPGSRSDTTTYVDLQRTAAQSFPGRVRADASSHFLNAVDDGLLDVMVDAARESPDLWVLALQPGGGAVARVAPEATAFPHRRPGYHLHVQGMVRPDDEREVHRAWVDEVEARVRPYVTGMRYGNVAMPRDDTDLASAAYGHNLGRLVALKSRLDPTDLFRYTPLHGVVPFDPVGTEPLFANPLPLVHNGRIGG